MKVLSFGEDLGEAFVIFCIYYKIYVVNYVLLHIKLLLWKIP
jgi:hypothetical protein